jgi:hypothetical protein
MTGIKLALYLFFIFIYHSDWWLGTRHDVVEGAWEWSSTGKPLSIFDWGPNQPCNGENNQDCLQIWHKSDYLWDDEFCTLRHNYIYESRYGDARTYIEYVLG